MSVCLTANQKKYLSYYQNYFGKHGEFPNTADAARYFGKPSTTVLNVIGAIFLKGGFTGGKPLTRNLLVAHGESKPLNIRATKAKKNTQQSNATLHE